MDTRARAVDDAAIDQRLSRSELGHCPLDDGNEVSPGSCSNASIANAFFGATGLRMTSAPLKPERMLAALNAAGVL
jgi:hypothetical protein